MAIYDLAAKLQSITSTTLYSQFNEWGPRSHLLMGDISKRWWPCLKTAIGAAPKPRILVLVVHLGSGLRKHKQNIEVRQEVNKANLE